MDANPSFSLSVLYRSDPIYSLCASDLMTASQTVNNNFIKEQKQLMKTLKGLEQQQLTRRRQLSEEQRTFAFIMNKRLSQRGPRPQTAPFSSTTTTTTSTSTLASSIPPPSVSGSRSAPAALSSHTGGHRGGGAKSANSRGTGVKFEQSSSPTLSPWALEHKENRDTQDRKVLKEYGPSAGQRCCCECGHSRELLTRRLSCPAILQRHHS